MARPSIPCTFLKQWTHESAYVLGYWFADGGIRARTNGGPEVFFVSNDLEHLHIVARTIGIGSIRRVSRFREGYRLNISRRELYDDLIRLGGTEQKSLNATWPVLPSVFLADFVRGYLDGDGWIGWQKRKQRYPLPAIGLYGTEAFVRGMAAAIEERTGIEIPTCHRHHGTWGVSWFGLQSKCIALWLYGDQPLIAMERKAIAAAEIIKWRPQKFYRDRITAKMWELFGTFLP